MIKLGFLKKRAYNQRMFSTHLKFAVSKMFMKYKMP